MTDLTIYRGDSKTWNLNFTNSSGQAIDITDYTIFFTVKKKNSYTDDPDDTDAIIKKDISIHTAPVTGQSQLVLQPSDTNTAVPAVYVYDMQLKDGSGNILTFISGLFTITADVTRRTS